MNFSIHPVLVRCCREEAILMCSYSITEKMGEFLVTLGIMSLDQVQDVLRRQQREPHKLFGQIAVDCGYIDDGAILDYADYKYDDRGR